MHPPALPMPRLLLPSVAFLLAKLVFFGALYAYWQDAAQDRARAATLRAETEHLLALLGPQAQAIEPALVRTSEVRLGELIARSRAEADASISWLAPVLLVASVVVFTAVLAHAWLALRHSRRVARRSDEAMHSLQTLLAAAPFAFLAWNSRRGVILWSDAAERMFGLPRDQVLGFPLPGVLERVRAMAADLRVQLDPGKSPSGIAMDLHDASGNPLHASVSLSHLPRSGDGSETVAAVIEDATPRLLREARRLDAVRAQRDALVREVHHRIKNHLQGVAGLLRQHLSGKPLLQPLLDVATAQVLSIAAVHGLQGEVSQGAPDLRMLIARIASSVSGILHAPIEMVDECLELGSMSVTEEEAVPIAMVLNELMMNAVKHRSLPDGGGPVRVEAIRDAGDARIEISNPGFLPPRFNLALGVHVGTGLGLVKSLLPQRGARLDIIEDGRQVIARLVLLAPEVIRTPTTVAAEEAA